MNEQSNEASATVTDEETFVPTGPHEHEFRVECKPDFAFLTVQLAAGQTLNVDGGRHKN